MDNLFFQDMQPGEEAKVSALIWGVFEECKDSGYKQEGIDEFKSFILPENIKARCETGQFVVICCKDGDHIVGVISIRDNRHISLLFVQKAYQRRGIARKFFDITLERCSKENFNLRAITVNSSSYAVAIYQRMGFEITDCVQEKSGITFTPMRYKLDAKKGSLNHSSVVIKEEGYIYKEIYLQALKEHFGLDHRRINHAVKVLDAAESIMTGEGVDGLLHKIIVITALLHDVGIKVAEKKYGSSSGSYQEQEGPPIVRKILACHGEDHIVIERVAYIVGNHHTAAKINGIDFQIIWEADWLVNIEEENLVASSYLPEILSRNFKTHTGMRMAQQRYA